VSSFCELVAYELVAYELVAYELVAYELVPYVALDGSTIIPIA